MVSGRPEDHIIPFLEPLTVLVSRQTESTGLALCTSYHNWNRSVAIPAIYNISETHGSSVTPKGLGLPDMPWSSVTCGIIIDSPKAGESE
jgi:hypothetical protein